MLVVLTGVVLYQTIAGTAAPVEEEIVTGPPTIGSAGTTIIGARRAGLTEFDASLPAGQLPAGRVRRGGAKDLADHSRNHPKVARARQDLHLHRGDRGRYRHLRVRRGRRLRPDGHRDAGNPKSWTHNPQFAFERVDAADAKPDFRISLTTPATVREGCGYEIQLETSCYNLIYGPDAEPRVFINLARWVRCDALPG